MTNIEKEQIWAGIEKLQVDLSDTAETIQEAKSCMRKSQNCKQEKADLGVTHLQCIGC